MHFGQATGYRNQTASVVEYDRRIRYLDYMENGQRNRGAGFVKMERRDDRCNISLQVSGLYRKDHFTRPLLMLTNEGERELCKLQFADGGTRTYLEGLNCRSLDRQGLEYESLIGLRIPISEGKEVQCLWGEKSESREQNAVLQNENARNVPVQNVVPRDVDEPEGPDREDIIAEPEVQMQENYIQEVQVQEAPIQEAQVQEALIQEAPIQEIQTQEPPMPEIKIPDIRTPESRRQSVSRRQVNLAAFKEDKWDQLWSVYPHIHPFSDEREYLSFGLSDFVVLSAPYYKLVNNSFLLHGFYNFHHLILTRVNGRNGVRYFIGVPGNLYQTERETAIMFGFEHFECDTEPAGKGDFGYYLIPVEL